MAVTNNKNFQSPTEKNFSYSFGQMYIMSRFVGIFPFYLKRNKYGEIIGPGVGFLDIAWWITSILKFFVLAICCFIIMKPFDKATNLVIHKGNLALIGVFSVVGFFIGLDMVNRNRFIVIFKTFEAFDRKVNHFPFSEIINNKMINLLKRFTDSERWWIIKK